jgi:hypothetical protein
VADIQEEASGCEEDPDLLAAVLLHILVHDAPPAKTVAQLVLACERDPAREEDRSAVEAALRSLQRDGLALRRGERFAPTRAAIRADALRF